MGRILPAALSCMLVASAISCVQGAEDANTRMLAEHNGYREEKGLNPLVLDKRLCEYAQKHAEDMASKHRLVHSSMSNLAASAGNGNVGENIACGQSCPEEAFEAWIKSPGHRANIASKRYTRVGFGVKEDDRGRKYWCAVFSA